MSRRRPTNLAAENPPKRMRKTFAMSWRNQKGRSIGISFVWMSLMMGLRTPRMLPAAAPYRPGRRGVKVGFT